MGGVTFPPRSADALAALSALATLLADPATAVKRIQELKTATAEHHAAADTAEAARTAAETYAKDIRARAEADVAATRASATADREAAKQALVEEIGRASCRERV